MNLKKGTPAFGLVLPDKEIKVIDLKSELKREQELSQQAADDAAGHTAAKTKE